MNNEQKSMRQRGTTYGIENNSYWQILQLMFGKYMWLWIIYNEQKKNFQF
jgi:hypothetical protein